VYMKCTPIGNNLLGNAICFIQASILNLHLQNNSGPKYNSKYMFKAGSYWVHRVSTHNLVMMCLWGMISAQLVQRIAKFVLTDIENAMAGVLDISQLEGLANLGTDGCYENHCWRDFIKKLPEPQLCRPWGFVVPLKNKMLGCFSRTTHMFQGLPLAGVLDYYSILIYIYIYIYYIIILHLDYIIHVESDILHDACEDDRIRCVCISI